MDAEDAVAELGIDLGGIGIIRQVKASQEAAMGALDAVILFPFFFLLELAFAGNAQNSVLQGTPCHPR